MKLEVGMYARTNKGTIFKINSTLEIDIDGQWYKDVEADRVFKDLIFDIGIFERVEKASHNIIHLIQENDFVNGYPVYEILEYKDDTRAIVIGDDNKSIIWEESSQYIKSIITKEQFEAMAYKVV